MRPPCTAAAGSAAGCWFARQPCTITFTFSAQHVHSLQSKAILTTRPMMMAERLWGNPPPSWHHSFSCARGRSLAALAGRPHFLPPAHPLACTAQAAHTQVHRLLSYYRQAKARRHAQGKMMRCGAHRMLRCGSGSGGGSSVCLPRTAGSRSSLAHRGRGGAWRGRHPAALLQSPPTPSAGRRPGRQGRSAELAVMAGM